jgi:hypothetical protein
MFYRRDGRVVTWLGKTLAPYFVRDGRHYAFRRAERRFRATKVGGNRGDPVWVQRIA